MKFILLLLNDLKRECSTYSVPSIEKKLFIKLIIKYILNYWIFWVGLARVDTYLPLISDPRLKQSTGKTFARYCRRSKIGGIPQKISPLETWSTGYLIHPPCVNPSPVLQADLFFEVNLPSYQNLYNMFNLSIEISYLL